jgi:hypothetical protein
MDMNWPEDNKPLSLMWLAKPNELSNPGLYGWKGMSGTPGGQLDPETVNRSSSTDE